MRSLIHSIARLFTFLWQLRLQQAVAGVLAISLLFATGLNSQQNDTSVGERFRERVQEIDQSTERPKTLGELRDEAREGVPLDERLKNITRDSAEAFKQFGQEYSIGAEEAIRGAKEKVTND